MSPYKFQVLKLHGRNLRDNDLICLVVISETLTVRYHFCVRSRRQRLPLRFSSPVNLIHFNHLYERYFRYVQTVLLYSLSVSDVYIFVRACLSTTNSI